MNRLQEIRSYIQRAKDWTDDHPEETVLLVGTGLCIVGVSFFLLANRKLNALEASKLMPPYPKGWEKFIKKQEKLGFKPFQLSSGWIMRIPSDTPIEVFITNAAEQAIADGGFKDI